MSFFSRFRVGVLLAGVLTACGDDATTTSTTPTTTTLPASSTPPTSTTSAPATTVPGPPADLMVQQILLRYDGQHEFGTLEITVCNAGEASAEPSAVLMIVSGTEFEMPPPGEILAGACADVFNPTSDFSTFGITAAGVVDVSASVITGDPDDPADNDTLTETVVVEHLTTMNADPADYDICLADGGSAEACQNLVFLFEPTSEPHQVKKQRGPVVVIVPVEYEALTSWLVASATLCGSYVEEYLGAPVPNPFSFRVIVTPDPAEQLFGAARTDRIMWKTDEATLDTWVGMLNTQWSDVLQGGCLNVHAHEITHLHVGLTPIPSWLDEGLATYVEGTTADATPDEEIACEIDGWAEGGGAVHPYIALADPYDPTRVRDYYLTGNCFWNYFESTYGREALQQVVAALVAVRDPLYGSCTPKREATGFLRDFVQPIIGEDVSALTEQRFGFGALWNSCEG